MGTGLLQRAFKTLSDPTRLRLLALLQEEELAVQELTEILDMAQSRVSGHLKTLREVGLVRDRRQGTFCFYRLAVPPDPAWRDLWRVVQRGQREDETIERDRARARTVVERRAARALEFFDSVAPRWDQLRGMFNDEALRARAIVELVPRSLRVLEVGTGTGALALELARHGLQVTAVDHSDAMLDALRGKLAASALDNVDLHQTDAAQLPSVDGGFDAVFAHMVLRYLPRPTAAIAEMTRVLGPGGTLVVVDFVRHQDDWMQQELGVQWLGFSAEQIREWFEESGLEQFHSATFETSSAGRRLPETFIASARRGDGRDR